MRFLMAVAALGVVFLGFASLPAAAGVGGICQGPADPRGCWCKAYPNKPECKPDPVEATNTRTEWGVEVISPEKGEYSRAGTSMGRSQSDDFVGNH